MYGMEATWLSVDVCSISSIVERTTLGVITVYHVDRDSCMHSPVGLD